MKQTTFQLGMITSPMLLLDIVREAAIESVTNRLATIWQEQHPQEHLPPDANFRLEIFFDVGVMTGLVDDVATMIVRRLETITVEVPS